MLIAEVHAEQEDPYLIRGLDYYCHTAFEFLDSSHSGLCNHSQYQCPHDPFFSLVCVVCAGRQSAVLAGGRYDGLMKQMGGRDEAGVGYPNLAPGTVKLLTRAV